MTLKNDIPDLIVHTQKQTPLLELNDNLFDVYEGELKKFIIQDLSLQFKDQALQQIIPRISPINVLKRLVDKMSKIYQQSPRRYVVEPTGNDNDSLLLEWYEIHGRVNQKMNVCNEFFNLFKNTLLQPMIINRMPAFRAIPSNAFTVYSNDIVDPTNPTHVVIFQGMKNIKTKQGQDNFVKVYHAYTDNEFLIYTSEGEILHDEMTMLGNPEGVNPFGKIPFVYINRSHNLLIPKQDSDTFTMTKLIPILLSDINYGVMYQAFSIFYGINVSEEEMKLGPSVFWRFKQDEGTDGKPEVGTISPSIEIDATLNLIKAQLSFWLSSRGIRPGSVGTLSSENFASGVSKMVDEMDTSDERKKQVGYFQDAESELWDLISQHLHPVWVRENLVETQALFSPGVKIKTDFAEQIPMLRRKDLIDELQAEMAAGLTTRRLAIKTLNPKMTDKELDQHMLDIDQERSIPVAEQVDEDENLTA